MMEVEILSWLDLRRRAVREFAPETAQISLGYWGSEPLDLARSPEHILRILCNDITPALVDFSAPRDMFQLPLQILEQMEGRLTYG